MKSGEEISETIQRINDVLDRLDRKLQGKIRRDVSYELEIPMVFIDAFSEEDDEQGYKSHTDDI